MESVVCEWYIEERGGGSRVKIRVGMYLITDAWGSKVCDLWGVS